MAAEVQLTKGNDMYIVVSPISLDSSSDSLKTCFPYGNSRGPRAALENARDFANQRIAALGLRSSLKEKL